MTYQVLRGGSFNYDVSRDLRSASRSWSEPELRYRFNGFRIVVRRRVP